MFPTGSEASYLALCSVREHNKSVIPKEVWDGIFVVSEVVVISSFEVDINPFELHQNKGNSVDETYYIWSPRIHVASNMELGGGEEIVVFQVFPVNHLQHFDGLAFTVWFAKGNLHAVFQEGVNLSVGFNKTHQCAGVGELLNRFGNGIFGGTGVELC